METSSIQARVARYIASHPGQTYRQIAGALNCSVSNIAKCARVHGVHRYRALTEDAMAALVNDNKISKEEK